VQLQSAQSIEQVRMRRTPWTVAGPPKSSTYRTAREWNVGKMTKGADQHDESRGAVKILGPSQKTYSIGIKLPSRPTNSQRLTGITGLLEISCQIPAHASAVQANDLGLRRHVTRFGLTSRERSRSSQTEKKHPKKRCLDVPRAKEGTRNDILSPWSLPCRPIRYEGSRRSISFAGDARSHPTEARQT
jgi:hypothetical protein